MLKIEYDICQLVLSKFSHAKFRIMNRTLSESKKKTVAARQKFKCANNKEKNLIGLENYECPMWRNKGDGAFDESQYDIDHIEEFSINQNDDLNNLQALCKCCHAVKTRRFMMTKKKSKPKSVKLIKKTEISFESFLKKYGFSLNVGYHYNIDNIKCHSILCEMINKRGIWKKFDFEEKEYTQWLKKENIGIGGIGNKYVNLYDIINFINKKSKKFNIIVPEIKKNNIGNETRIGGFHRLNIGRQNFGRQLF